MYRAPAQGADRYFTRDDSLSRSGIRRGGDTHYSFDSTLLEEYPNISIFAGGLHEYSYCIGRYRDLCDLLLYLR
ncbi:hypothetical protein TRIP_E280161 [uncultured Spirochaetota bacterium]|uniref:Uncharacterized protein n=1 Tax=uncultured Spirochaetota bacterium TaxID=460511 RepID=A0A652ZWL3_9SPIR|nr:hypothetical protein TRIP_E280161 [uncultured Spirochaetota bacterium]